MTDAEGIGDQNPYRTFQAGSTRLPAGLIVAALLHFGYSAAALYFLGYELLIARSRGIDRFTVAVFAGVLVFFTLTGIGLLLRKPLARRLSLAACVGQFYVIPFRLLRMATGMNLFGFAVPTASTSTGNLVLVVMSLVTVGCAWWIYRTLHRLDVQALFHRD